MDNTPNDPEVTKRVKLHIWQKHTVRKKLESMNIVYVRKM